MSISVVIVDDDVDTVDIFEEYLELQGFNVMAKGMDGKEAVELYEKHQPDVLCSDIMMPNYDGFYAMENIRKKFPDAKIILVTADLTTDTKEKLKKSNASAVIFKPYDIDVVVKTINDVVKGKNSSQEHKTEI